MRRIVWLAALAGLVATGLVASGLARAALPVGQAAPEFTAPATLGGQEFRFSLAEALRHGPVVLYFYPAAFTKGCTLEAHAFATAIDRFKALGASVIGVSADGIAKLDKFSVSACQSKFPLVADADRSIMQAYDSVLASSPSRASRTSYVITPDDRVLYTYSSMKPDKHVANTYAALAAWRAAHPQDAASRP